MISLNICTCPGYRLNRNVERPNTLVLFLGWMAQTKQAQRDRFRRRIKELEAERENDQREARAAQGVMENLQRDNLQLYEKVQL
ncbi:unnamed protein product, partial [Sphacelaria rigidula]